MSLAPFDTYCAETGDQFQMRRWVLRAIVLSLGLHAGLLVFFHFTKLESFRFAENKPEAMSRMLWRMVDLPEIPAEEGKAVPMVEPIPVAPIPISVDKPNDDLAGVPWRPAELVVPAADVEPLAGIGGVDMGEDKDSRPRVSLENLFEVTMGGLLTDGTRIEDRIAVQGPADPINAGSDVGSSAGIPSRQSLDKVLEQTGPLPVGNATVEVPGGALYEYNSDELRPDAIEQLLKLGELIRRNPQATISIEGHTDALGTPEYNQVLSEKRAESVKKWLVQDRGVDPARIQTRGFGSSRLIVPADRTIDEQQPNRRVEIVIKTNR